MFTEEGGGDWRIKIGQPLYVIDKLQSANQPPDFVQHSRRQQNTHPPITFEFKCSRGLGTFLDVNFV